jgi:hypothetical protein
MVFCSSLDSLAFDVHMNMSTAQQAKVSYLGVNGALNYKEGSFGYGFGLSAYGDSAGVSVGWTRYPEIIIRSIQAGGQTVTFTTYPKFSQDVIEFNGLLAVGKGLYLLGGVNVLSVSPLQGITASMVGRNGYQVGFVAKPTDSMIAVEIIYQVHNFAMNTLEYSASGLTICGKLLLL